MKSLTPSGDFWMKIALYNLTTTTKLGGIETFNWEMARALERKGHCVHIYGGRNAHVRDDLYNVPIYTYPYIKRSFIPNFGSRFRKFMERFSFGVSALRDISIRGYDYIYVSKPYDVPLTLLAAVLSQAKVIYGSGGTEFFPGYAYLMKKVDYFFACSHFNALQIERYCGIRPQVLPNGVNTDVFKPLPIDSDVRQELAVADGQLVIISACRLVGWKGLQYAIKAVARLLRKGYSVKYYIIGDGEYKETLHTLVKDLAVEKSVIFLGNMPNAVLPRYYSLATVALFPSIANETFGISIAEAMACGVPVISTTVGGIPEVLGEGSGLLVSPENDHDLAAALEKLITDEKLRKKLGDAGRQRVSENFNWDKVVDRFERYLQSG